MEGHRCKLCLKSFMNGRALGGHMRSHIFNHLPPHHLVPPKPANDSSSSEEGTTTSYELRENPRTNIRLVDQEFSFVLQDRESETESSMNPIQRRRRRRRKRSNRNYYRRSPIIKPVDDDHKQARKLETMMSNTNNQPSSKTTESWTDQAASSISNATTEEDVAFCLMLLSKDTWIINKDETEQEETENDPSSSEEEDALKQEQIKNQRGKCNYKCETCNKVFKSYQALGGHRASHKKIRLDSPKLHPVNPASTHPDNHKIHQCPVCCRVFSSGQALGGHKRSHVMMAGAGAVVSRRSSTNRSSGSFIDLNLPAPPEDFTQIELSAVSDPEFARRY